MHHATRLFAATIIWGAAACPPELQAESLGAALAKPCAVCHGKKRPKQRPRSAQSGRPAQVLS